MREDQHQFLQVHGQLPARLTSEQMGWLLNCQPHDVPALVAARLIKPLGNPAPNCIKFFSRDEVLELAKERTWLNRITLTINTHWARQNAQRKKRAPNTIDVMGHNSASGTSDVSCDR